MTTTEVQREVLKYGLSESQKLQDKPFDLISLSMSISTSNVNVSVFIHHKNQIAYHYDVWWNDTKQMVDNYIELAKVTIKQIERREKSITF